MESFEQFVALALEAEGFVVSEAIKFPVRRQTRKLSHSEVQTHGYEVDLVGARADRLVLATVKPSSVPVASPPLPSPATTDTDYSMIRSSAMGSLTRRRSGTGIHSVR